MDAKDLFKGMKDAKARYDSNWLRAGVYWARVEHCKNSEDRKMVGMFVVEFTIIHVFDNDENKGHRTGETVSHIIKRNNDSFLPTVKSFIANTMQADPEMVDEHVCAMVCSDQQPLKGQIVEMRNRIVVTKAGKDFTQIAYKRPVPKNELMEVLTEDEKKKFFPSGFDEYILVADRK